MNSTLKVFGLLIAFFTLTLIGLLIGLNVHAQTTEKPLELTNDQAVIVQQIKNREDDILYSEPKKIPILDGIDDIIGYNEVVDYDYKGMEIDGSNIIFTGDKQYSNIEKLDDDTFKIHATYDFYREDNGQVREILHERINKAIWDKSTIPTTIEKIEALLKTPYAIADTYLPTSDGFTGNTSQSSWSLAYNNTPSGINQDENCVVEAHQHEANKYSITRCYFIFDTSNLDDSLTVGTSSLFLYGQESVGSENYNVYTSSTTALTTGSWFQIGATALAQNIVGSSLSITGYNEFILNSVGTSTVSKTGTSAFVVRQVNYDVGNTAPAAPVYRLISVKSSATAGTAQDPYLIVNTITPPEEEEITSSSTPQFLTCSPQKNNELSVITGCAIANDGTATTTTSFVFHIPFIVWLILFLLVAFIGERLIVEFLIRWRK